MTTIEQINDQVRAMAGLPERLEMASTRIGRMCSEGRPPRMTIPVHFNDDDIFITTTLQDAIDEIRRLNMLVHGRDADGKLIPAKPFRTN